MTLQTSITSVLDQPLPKLDGTQIGPYTLLSQLGRGAMGVVYEAEQISLGRRVALKILPFAALLNETQLERFNTEATAAARLQHSGIVHHLLGRLRAWHSLLFDAVDRRAESGRSDRRDATGAASW